MRCWGSLCCRPQPGVVLRPQWGWLGVHGRHPIWTSPGAHSVLFAVLLSPLHLQTPHLGIPPLQVMRYTGGAGVQPCVCVCIRVCTCAPPGQPPLRVHVCACIAGSTAGSYRPPHPPPRLHRHRGAGGGRRPGGGSSVRAAAGRDRGGGWDRGRGSAARCGERGERRLGAGREPGERRGRQVRDVEGGGQPESGKAARGVSRVPWVGWEGGSEGTRE